MQRSHYLIDLIFSNYNVNNNLIDRLIFDVLNDIIKNFVIDQIVNMMTIDVILINNEIVDVLINVFDNIMIYYLILIRRDCFFVEFKREYILSY